MMRSTFECKLTSSQWNAFNLGSLVKDSENNNTS